MKENFPSLAKEIDFQEAERVPKKLNARHIIVKLPKIKDKERILKTARKKGDSYLQRSSHKTVHWFLKRDLTGQKRLERSIRSQEKQGPTSEITVSSKAFI